MIEMNRTGEWLVGLLGAEEAGCSVGELLRERWKLPKKTVHLLFQHKEVLLSGEAAPQHAKTEKGQEIRLRVCQPESFGLDPVMEPLQILYEDDHLLVVDKPAGLLLHPTENRHTRTLDHLVAGHFAAIGLQAKVRHIHRLDQETSGAVLYAKHALAAALLDEKLRLRQVKRSYVAFVHGRIRQESGTINEPIGKDRHHPQRRRVTPQGDPAITHFRVRQRYQAATQVECQLDTGRTHQIRVHFSYLGYPLIGDALYGGKPMGIARQALHAERLRLTHPFGGREVTATAAWPAELTRLQSSLQL